MRALVAGLLAAATVAASASAGSYSPPPGDHQPVWSPDGTAIVYLALSQGTRSLRVMAPDGSGNRRLPLPALIDVGPTPFAFSPDWFWVAFGGNELLVSRPDGSEQRRLSDLAFGSVPAWSPDGRTIAFSRTTGLHVVGVDGSGLRRISDRYASRLEWSPDGELIAFSTRDGDTDHVFVVRPDATSETSLTRALPGSHGRPVWAPDGQRLALWTVREGQRPAMTVVSRVGAPLARLEHEWSAADLAWSPDGRRLLVSGWGLWVVDVEASAVRLLAPFGADARWSPDGRQIAFAGAGECRDRTGIYRIDVEAGVATRLTNDCRIVGTARGETLRASDLADVVLGLGGDDRLTAVDPAYTGDTLLGGSGADVLLGDGQGDVLDGGAGTDRLTGRAGPDVVRGGPGSDVLRGEGGRDQLYAEDGRRDIVSCGTNRLRATGPEDDVAWVDRRDAVSRDCELVYRGGRIDLAAGPTRLVIRVDLAHRPGERELVWMLRCRPAGGTLPSAGRACRLLGSMTGPLAPVSDDRLCAQTPHPAHAHVTGVLAGRRVDAGFGRSTTCELERWDRHRFLLEPR
jgi:hypothetical protein